MVWAASCVLLPILTIEATNSATITLNETILLFSMHFFFIAAIAVSFDIRDIFQDKSNELKTIPVIFGEKNSLLICQVLLATYLLLLFNFTEEIDGNFCALSLTIFISGWLILKSKWKKNEYYYFLFLDGTMILQLIMLLIFSTFPL
jgi:4-hydroxybenzoate polyprenyltransferase